MVTWRWPPEIWYLSNVDIGERVPNVSLTPEMEAFLEQEVSTGRYASLSEAVRAGVALLKQRAREDQLKLEALRYRALKARQEILRAEATTLDGVEAIDDFMDSIVQDVADEASP